MNRMVDPDSKEWAEWVLLLTLGGFLGNFVFSLSDHAQNNFFSSLEWVPVVASAIAVGFLVVPLLLPVERSFIDLCAVILDRGGRHRRLGLCPPRRWQPPRPLPPPLRQFHLRCPAPRPAPIS